MKYEQLERRTLMNRSSTFLCLHIVKKTHNLRFCECLLHLKALYERLYFCIGWLVRLFIIRRIPCGDITCSARLHTLLRVSSDPI